jgi:anthranilate phosphoribosyltransferase
VTDETVPLINEVTTTVGLTNHQLERVDTITAGVQQVTTNVSALTSLLAATLGSPVVKVAAFTYGVRRAMSDRRHDDIEKRVKSELKAEKKSGRRGAGKSSTSTAKSDASKDSAA